MPNIKFKKKIKLMFYLPVFFEQCLATLITMLGTMLVSDISSEAVSGVGMVDSMNYLFMNLLVAIGTGITAVVSQAVGKKKPEDAANASAHSITLSIYASVILGTLIVVFRGELLMFLFGQAEEKVLEAAYDYLFFTAISLPLLAVFNVISGIRRGTGDNFSPLIGSFLANVFYILVSLICIYGLNLGVRGVGLGLLLSRIISTLTVVFILIKKPHDIKIKKLPLKPNFNLLKPVLKIALPCAGDSLAFNGGKILVQIFMSGMGTPALAANSICNSLANFLQLPSKTLQITCVPLTGTAFGSRDYTRTRKTIISQTMLSIISQILMSILFFIFFTPLIHLFTYDNEIIEISKTLMFLMYIAVPLFWGTSFVTPNAIRATGDAKFTMRISIISMFLCRVLGSWFFGVYLEMGMFGIWFSMTIDWLFRSIFYVPRIFSKKWEI